MKSCIIATMFIVAMIFTMYNSDSTLSIQQFTDVLSTKQKAIYKKIADERRNIYFKGFGLGLVLSFLFLFWKSSIKNSYKINRFSTICVVGAITFITNYFYYMLSPKNDYMILHLNEENQRKKWLNINKTMQFNYHVGLLLGIIASMVLAHGVKC
jgi:uncharacterized protein YacL